MRSVSSSSSLSCHRWMSIREVIYPAPMNANRRNSWLIRLQNSWSMASLRSMRTELHATAKVSPTCCRWLRKRIRVRLRRIVVAVTIVETSRSIRPSMMIRLWVRQATRCTKMTLLWTQMHITATIDRKSEIWMTHSHTRKPSASIDNKRTRTWQIRCERCEKLELDKIPQSLLVITKNSTYFILIYEQLNFYVAKPPQK